MNAIRVPLFAHVVLTSIENDRCAFLNLVEFKFLQNNDFILQVWIMSDKPLYLEKSHVRFRPPSKTVSVFFDECNREVISVTTGATDSKTKALFLSVDHNGHKIELNLPVEKKILSIKLNPTASVLAYHVEKSYVEFFNVKKNSSDQGSQIYSLDDKRFVQSTRAKNSKLIGFLWTSTTEVVMITDIDIEYYSVDAARRRLRHLKSFPSATNWFVYQPPKALMGLDSEIKSQYSVLMVSTGSLSSTMQPYLFRRSQIYRLQKFDVEGDWQCGDRLELFERSITIAFLYDYVRLLVLQHESLNVKSRGAQILIYTVDPRSGFTSKTHTLDLDVSGRFAISIHDNLVVVHDEPSKTSSIFDIMIKSTEKSDCAGHFVSLIGSQPLRSPPPDDSGKRMDMYSLNWVFFQPNFIIDAKLGLLFILHIDLDAVQNYLQDSILLLSFLSNRRRSEKIILKKLRLIVSDSCSLVRKGSQISMNPLTEVSSAIEIVAQLVVSADSETYATTRDRIDNEADQTNARLTQEEIQREVLQQLDEPKDSSPALTQFVISTLVEFIFAMGKQEKNVDFCIYNQLVRLLVREKRYYQLAQMIRCGILRDSEKLAYLLMSDEIQHERTSEMGLNMLQRLDCVPEMMSSMSL